MLLEFAAKKKRTRKTRNCSKGYNCGNSCINKSLNCKRKFSDQASTYAGWLKLNAEKLSGKTVKKTKTGSVADALRLGRPLTDQERSQPDKLIEVGKAFAAKYDLKKAIADRADYEAKRKEFYVNQTKEKKPLFELQGSLRSELADVRTALDNYDPMKEKGFKRKNELRERRTELNNEIEAITEKLRTRDSFDEYDALTRKLDWEMSDSNLAVLARDGRTAYSIDKTKFNKLKRQRNKDIPLVQKARLEAMENLPGNKEFRQALNDLAASSPLSKSQASDIARNEIKYQEDAVKVSRYVGKSFSKLGSKDEIESMRSDVTDIVQLTGSKPKPLSIAKVKGETRAWAQMLEDDDGNYTGGRINIGNSYSKAQGGVGGKTDMYHEFSHHLEYQHQEIALANTRWRDGRATGGVTRLSAISNRTYSSDERAVPDDFADPYVGKVYSPKGRKLAIATEVLTMGVQHFASSGSMADLFDKDPEHFYLTLGSIIEIQNKNRRVASSR